MRKTLLATSAVLALSVGAAFAAVDTDAIVADLQANGYTSIEIKVGATQVKAEASDGVNKIEVIYDATTGEILSQETSPADDSDNSVGVEISSEDGDFLDDGEGDDDLQDDESDDDESDDDGEDDDSEDDSDDDSDSSDDEDD
ncbi:MAG: PepSY domain-containing protein [Planctomycetota bacterium]|nr:MAG: PepSY domain-containing protein [Planctomycetota bacterium]